MDGEQMERTVSIVIFPGENSTISQFSDGKFYRGKIKVIFRGKKLLRGKSYSLTETIFYRKKCFTLSIVKYSEAIFYRKRILRLVS